MKKQPIKKAVSIATITMFMSTSILVMDNEFYASVIDSQMTIMNPAMDPMMDQAMNPAVDPMMD